MILSWLYLRKIPKTLTGSLVLLNTSILEVLCFMEPSHIASVFFLFNSYPEMAPNTSIVWRCDLRESVLFVMIVVSSANCEILASLSFGRRIPLQFGLWRIFKEWRAKWTPLSHTSCYFKIIGHTAAIHNSALYVPV